MSAAIRILLVDDSATFRRSIAAILSTEADLEIVGEARDGQAALELASRLGPDLILLDLEMPRMDGFTFLRLFRVLAKTPVLVFSRHHARTDLRLALELGAIGILEKPRAVEPGDPPTPTDLVEKIRAAVARDREAVLTAQPPPAPLRRCAPRIVVVGASAGGPKAIQWLLSRLPADLPLALVVAQHMPAQFTGPFAERLDRASAFTVAEGQDGDLVLAGHCFVAPGGTNLVLGGTPSRPRLESTAADARYRPSVDLLFGSAARLCGPQAMGIVLTGMGDDGARGVVELRAAGGQTLAEASETAAVFGMPEAAIATGAIERVLPLPALLTALLARGQDA